MYTHICSCLCIYIYRTCTCGGAEEKNEAGVSIEPRRSSNIWTKRNKEKGHVAVLPRPVLVLNEPVCLRETKCGMRCML